MFTCIECHNECYADEMDEEIRRWDGVCVCVECSTEYLDQVLWSVEKEERLYV